MKKLETDFKVLILLQEMVTFSFPCMQMLPFVALIMLQDTSQAFKVWSLIKEPIQIVEGKIFYTILKALDFTI